MGNCVDYIEAQIMASAVERFIDKKLEEGLNRNKIIKELKKEINKGWWNFYNIPAEEIVKEAQWCYNWFKRHQKKYGRKQKNI